MKRAKSLVSWGIRLAILAALAYFLRPLYAPPKPTLPSDRGANDFVSWTFLGDTNQAVCQKLTVYGDGRTTVLITRPMGDPDLPDLNAQWKVRRDKATGLSQFTRESVLAPDRAKQLLDAALKAGALDLQPEAASDTDRLRIDTSFAASQHSALGPQFIGSPVDWHPGVWINRLRWQKLGTLISSDSDLRSLLAKKQVTLVDDNGNPVK